MPIGEDRATLRLHLTQAEAAVVEGTRHVKRQREILAELHKHGHDTLRAEELLSTFEETLALHIEDRDRLRKDLREASGA